MKIAGRKNDGAWYRTNVFIKKYLQSNPNEQSNFSTAIAEIETLPAYIAALNDLSTKTGATSGDNTSQLTETFLVNQWATVGIPRTVYEGKLSFDTYTKVTAGGKTKYVPDHAKAAADFASDLRQVCKQFIFGARTLNDIINIRAAFNGNPGGIANATKDPG